MSYDVGAGGAFGLLLSEYAEVLGPTYESFSRRLAADEDDEAIAEDDYNDHNERRDVVAEEYVEPMIEAFYVIGIFMPEPCWLHYTGSEDERPGRTVTPPDDFVLGFGLFTMPWNYPEMHESFKKAADWHTWVWGG